MPNDIISANKGLMTMNKELLESLGINPNRLKQKVARAQKAGLTKAQKHARELMVADAKQRAINYAVEMKEQRGNTIPKMDYLLSREEAELKSLITSLSGLIELGFRYKDDVAELEKHKEALANLKNVKLIK